MLGRLIVGILKGLIVGGLIGFALFKVGLGTPPVVVAYIAAALTGVLVGLVAGKPIWVKDAKVEASTKAVVGALLGAGLLAAVRNWLTLPIPVIAPLAEFVPKDATISGFAITALAAVAAVLGGFYEADNNPSDPKSARAVNQVAGGAKKRIAPSPRGAEEADEANHEQERKRERR